MEVLLEYDEIETDNEKMASLNHSELQSHLAFLLRLAYRHQYSILTELDFDFASGKIRPDVCIMERQQFDWTEDEITMKTPPITTIEILSPEQGLDGLMKRINQRHFPAGVQSVWVVLPAVQLVSIFLPDRQRINFSEGIITDPVTGIQLELTAVFEG